MRERCDCHLSRPLGCLFPELRLKTFGEHEGDNDRSEDFDIVSPTVHERASLISIRTSYVTSGCKNMNAALKVPEYDNSVVWLLMFRGLSCLALKHHLLVAAS